MIQAIGFEFRQHHTNARAVWLFTAFLLSGAQAVAREKSDVLHMNNGDTLTGEIKLLEHGKLRLGTAYMGDVSIEWDDVAKLESDFEFQLERVDGNTCDRTH